MLSAWASAEPPGMKCVLLLLPFHPAHPPLCMVDFAHQQQPTALCSWLLALQHPISFLLCEWWWLIMSSLSLYILNKHMASRPASAVCCPVALGTADHSASSGPVVNPADPSHAAKINVKRLFLKHSFTISQGGWCSAQQIALHPCHCIVSLWT